MCGGRSTLVPFKAMAAVLFFVSFVNQRTNNPQHSDKLGRLATPGSCDCEFGSCMLWTGA